MNFNFFPPQALDDTKRISQWWDRALSYHPGDETQSGGWDQEQWEREIRVPGFDPAKIFEQARARLINFDVLPPELLEVTTQWNVEEHLPQPGDLMIQRTHLFKIGNFRLADVLSAVKITQIIDEPRRFALQYVTVKGHPEKGQSTYTITWTDDNRILFTMQPISKPGNLLTRLANPIITQRIRLKVTHAILDTLAKGVLLDLTGYEDV
ncbi:MAG: hypothetical protein DPW16_04610 [Chloroflexi bacterium]|nr:hypothetical protein [Chloroflexota bacterium]